VNSFFSRVTDLLITPVKKLGPLSAEKLQIVFDLLKAYVFLVECALEWEEMDVYFNVLGDVFNSSSTPLFKSNPYLFPRRHQAIGVDQHFFPILMKAILEAETIEQLLDLSASVVPASKYTTPPSFQDVCKKITKRLTTFLKSDSCGSQIASQVFSILLENADLSSFLQTWITQIFLPALTSGVFGSTLLTLQAVKLLLERDVYLWIARDWISECFQFFQRIKINSVFAPYLAMIWSEMAPTQAVDQSSLRALWSQHSIQSDSDLAPFFAIFAEMTRTIPQNKLTFFIDIILSPDPPSRSGFLS
jgi:hypothetical protein